MKLQELFTALDDCIIAPADWRPWATLDDREFWEKLQPTDRDGILERAEAALAQPWPELTATRFLDFARNGNRTRYQDDHFARRHRLRDLTLAECIDNRGRFLDAIINGLWLLCEESYWGVPAHIGMQRAGSGLPDVEEPTVDLFAAETSALLSIVDYLLGERFDAVSPLIRRRLRYETQRRILGPLLEREDFSWMGYHGRPVNNWNPWIISNWLATALLLEADPDRRIAHLRKCIHCLDFFIAHYPPDGGCDEGPSYWGRAGASLFDSLDLLHRASGGKLDAFDQPLVREMGRYIYRLHIDQSWFVNFADAAAINEPGALLVHRFGTAVGDPDMQHFGAFLYSRHQRTALDASLLRGLADLQVVPAVRETPPVAPQPRDVWLPGINVMAARDSAGTAAGLFLAAKGGHNAESHNHNDIGHFIVYYDGAPLLVDAGVETYSRQTFSADRYTIWTMQSAYHNLPTVNGCMQMAGVDFRARDLDYQQDDRRARLEMEIAAWPEEAAIDSWRRTIELVRGDHVRVHDRWRLNAVREPLRLHLLTCCEVVVDPMRLKLERMELPGGRHSARGIVELEHGWRTEVEEVPVTDGRLTPVWGNRLHRITMTLPNTPPRGEATLRIRCQKA